MLLVTPVLLLTSRTICIIASCGCSSVDVLWICLARRWNSSACCCSPPLSLRILFILRQLSGWVSGSLLSQMLAGRARLHVCHQSGQVTATAAACHSCRSSGHWRCRRQASTPGTPPQSTDRTETRGVKQEGGRGCSCVWPITYSIYILSVLLLHSNTPAGALTSGQTIHVETCEFMFLFWGLVELVLNDAVVITAHVITVLTF